MLKSILYYTDNRLQEPIFSKVQERLKAVGLPIVSMSLKKTDFGQNFTFLGGEPSYYTMLRQIIFGLRFSRSKYIFFCEHDVLYNPSHFDIIPGRDDIFFYNANVWRWDYPTERLFTYDRLISLSGMVCNRELALRHFTSRLELIELMKWDQDNHHEPSWLRKMGYEPGTKKKKRGGFSDDDFECFLSEYPIIDIRHKHTFSPPKTTLKNFKHLPTGWREITIDNVTGNDDLRELL